MNCEHFRSVQEYLDGRLDGPSAGAARAHLEACDACARDAGLHRALGGALRAGPSPDPGARFTAAVMGTVRALPARGWGQRAWASLTCWELAGLAALYALVLAGIPYALRWLGGIVPIAAWRLSPDDLTRSALSWLGSPAGTAASRTLRGWTDTLPMSVSVSASVLAGALLLLLRRPVVRSVR